MWWWSLFGCPAPSTPIGVTLVDGQVIVGEVTTDVLQLKGAYGEVSVPLGDVGMVLPVEGQGLADSGGHVTVWLRNGSELRGQWTEPELEMSFLVGGAMHPIEVPTPQLQALQLRASEAWPAGDSYRVKTTHGDDFLVDPQATTITVKSELGSFGVTLAECTSVGPIGAPTGPWRFVLETGTVLIGAPAEKTLTFALPMGPGTLDVPLASLVSLSRGGWSEGYYAPSPAVSAPMVIEGSGGQPDQALNVPKEPEEAEQAAQAYPARQVTARPGLSSAGGWFENSRLEAAKR